MGALAIPKTVDVERLLQIWLPDGGSTLMLEAYFDESGTHGGSPVMCVGGYLFGSEQCKRFQANWDEFLNGFGLDYFHMAECAHGTGGFANISPHDRDQICRRLISYIKLWSEIGIVVSVCEADYDLGNPFPKWNAYRFCVQECIQGINSWATRYRYGGGISYIFESGHAHQESANSLINGFAQSESLSQEMRYASHAFVKGKRLCGIAAADMLAWEWAKDFKSTYGPVRRNRRLSLISLMDKRHLARHWTLATLQRYRTVCAEVATGQIAQIPEEFRHYPDSVTGFIVGEPKMSRSTH